MQCTKCGVEITEVNRAIHSKGKIRGDCRPCYNRKMRNYFAKQKKDNPKFIAKLMLRSAKRRSILANFPYSLDTRWLQGKLKRGVCEVTGLRFEASAIRGESDEHSGFFAPSLDRINSKLGYTKRNTRLVIWGYNRAKGDNTDREVQMLAYAVLKGRL